MQQSLDLHVILHVIHTGQTNESRISAASLEDAIDLAIEGERSGNFSAIRISGSSGSHLMDEARLRSEIESRGNPT